MSRGIAVHLPAARPTSRALQRGRRSPARRLVALAAVQRSLTLASLTESLMGAVRTSAMIALILAGAAFLSLAMGFTGLPRHLAEWIASLGLTKFQLLMALLVFYIVIGCFLDGISAVPVSTT